MQNHFRPLFAAAVGAALLASPAFAETLTYSVALTGAEEVPPVTTTATGTVDATYDTETKVLTWTVAYDGLSGPARAAHFHAPAPAGENAPPVIPIEGDLASPIEGTATLTDEQAQQLQDGLVYFNVHTEANGGGEIRGQIVVAN